MIRRGRAAPKDSATTRCANCPFAPDGPGANLRRTLRPGRMREIQRAVLMGAPFWCHKTTDDEAWDEDGDRYLGNGRERECGGAAEFRRTGRMPRASRSAKRDEAR